MGGKPSRITWPQTDMKGRTVIVTGANAGIGYETAKHIALLGGKVILACRNDQRAQAAMMRMEADLIELKSRVADLQGPQIQISEPDDTGSTAETEADGASVMHSADVASLLPEKMDVEYMHLDLGSLASVAAFAAAYKDKGYPLHVLVNNAGIALVPQSYTIDGFEKQFQVNHLGHFLLILHLLPVMRASGPDCRIINVSSEAHRSGKLDLSNIQGQKHYSKTDFYNNSKLFQIMLTECLEKRLKETSVSSYSVHPGLINTDLLRGFEQSALMSVMRIMGKVTDDVERGAATSIYLAVTPYVKEMRGYYFSEGVPITPSAAARKSKDQEVLWNYSCSLVERYISVDLLVDLKLPEEPEEEKK